uniref:Olfactomedin-4-like n=1 Tax=Petromyzon marinus TaxID=7757 RepID=A0AAJ7WZ58_PETMA|nr:olfactomedin-4-like [Petromyzon marinus]
MKALLSIVLGLLFQELACAIYLAPGAYTNSSRDAEGQCVCNVYLPDPVFPADMVEQLQLSTQTIATAVTVESKKVAENHATLVRYTGLLQNLTVRVERMEQGHDRYTELDFELLRVEIREMEQLVQQLKLEVSSATLDRLHLSIQNISVVVNTLDSYDRNNVLLIRHQVDTLRKQLQDCQNAASNAGQAPSNNADQPAGNNAYQPPIGSCAHGGLQNVSAPYIHILNMQGVGYLYGAFGKDPLPLKGREDVYWVITSYQIYFTVIQMFANHRALQTSMLLEQKTLSCGIDCGYGMDAVMYKNHMFYRCSTGVSICKYNMTASTITRANLPQASGTNSYPYLGSTYSDMDFSVDEQGLWVIYSADGKVSLALLNDTSLAVINSWTTTQYKPSVSNGFMVCGVLYLTRTYSLKTEEIYFAFDSKTNQERYLSIMMDKPMEKMSSLSYNAVDRNLYMYDQGYMVTYNVILKGL